VLAVTLYGITRDEDHELAMLGLVCRVAEGVLGSLNTPHGKEERTEGGRSRPASAENARSAFIAGMSGTPVPTPAFASHSSPR
jgi:hypothetical protein